MTDAETQLAEQNDAENPLEDEVRQLRLELRNAQEKLELELTRRNSTESAAGSQIDELLDELNQLRSQSQSKEESASARINTLEAQYAALEAEHETLKQDAERSSAYAETQTKMLQEALSDT